MAIQNYKIPQRYFPSDKEQADLERRIGEYNIAFDKQEEFMMKEIGLFLPMNEYGAYLILAKAIIVPEKSKGGIYKPNQSIQEAKREYDVGLVIGIGPQAFRESDRFPFGPTCKIGDWIAFSRFEQACVKFNRHDCFFLNDDKIKIPIPDVKQAFPELF
jgi:co-chaperonin GroES (HSP10)